MSTPQITDLTGLEHATFLEDLSLCGNQIHDLQPLSGLIHLKSLSLCANQISDLSPLANLTNLIGLDLGINGKISDITALANLTQLERLNLGGNLIEDISPLANLINLWQLNIQSNLIADISPVLGLNLTDFRYDEVCDIDPLLPSVRERIENRNFPSVFKAWGNLTELEDLTRANLDVRYGLLFSTLFNLRWRRTGAEPTRGVSTQVAGNLEHSREVRQRALDHNPNMVFLAGIDWYKETLSAFPPDSEFWLRDANNQIVQNDVVRWIEYQIDFFHPGYQDIIVEKIVAIDRCGLFDGVMLDGFANNATGFVGRGLRPVNDEEIIAVMTNILSRARARVRDDFLILVNAGRSKATAYTEYVNGTYMETGVEYPGGYTHGRLAQIENTLLWSEENLRSPRINCLEGYGAGVEPPDSLTNHRWMRVFTTMGLTHSDGYVLYNTGLLDDNAPYGGADEHFWYPFWDANLGRPIGAKAQPYQDIDGLYIREFTNGWAVYNRSGKEQTITLPRVSTGVSSNKQDLTHLLPDLDGEIYLTTKSFADVNGDGDVNVLDLVQVANGFGKSTPDPNGDGMVNILDLVFVVQQFSQ